MFPRYVKRQATDPSGTLSTDWGEMFVWREVIAFHGKFEFSPAFNACWTQCIPKHYWAKKGEAHYEQSCTWNRNQILICEGSLLTYFLKSAKHLWHFSPIMHDRCISTMHSVMAGFLKCVANIPAGPAVVNFPYPHPHPPPPCPPPAHPSPSGFNVLLQSINNQTRNA